MPRWLTISLILIVLLANASASCLFSGSGPIAPQGGEAAKWNPLLHAVAEALTMPFPTAGIADVRAVVLPAGLGAMLAVLGVASFIARKSTADVGARLSSADPAHSRLADRASPDHALEPEWTKRIFVLPGGGDGAAERWLTTVGAGVIVLALASMLANQTREMSWGWLTLLAAGVAWSALIARTLDARMAQRALAGILGIGAIAMALSLAHRTDRGLAHFTWPIGPITITAAMAGVWGAVAIAWAGHRTITQRRLSFATAALLLFAALAGYVLLETGRRASALGMIGGVTGAAALAAWYSTRNRTARTIIAGCVVIGLSLSITYFVRQATSERRETSGPVRLRLEFWRLSADLIRQHPFAGIGPGMFVVGMTNAVAPLRAESPHVYHGNVDPYAHNEWLQAFVELGLPGGLLYTALPLGVVLLTIRRSARDPASPGAAVRFAAAAGLLTIFVTELASITMRSPIMPVCYWTLVGICAGPGQVWHRLIAGATSTLGSLRFGPPDRPPPPAGATRLSDKNRLLASVTLMALAALCWTICVRDIRAAGAEVRNRPGPDGRFASRLYPEMTVTAWTKAATLALQEALSKPTESTRKKAVDLWREVYSLLPGYSGVAVSYSEALMAAGRNDEAREVLRRTIEGGIDPYNPEINAFYARLLGDDAVGRFRCVQRGLRGGALNGELQEILRKCLANQEIVWLIANLGPGGRYLAIKPWLADPHPPAGTMPVAGSHALEASTELLRILAFDAQLRGDLENAIGNQSRAADYYALLEERSDPRRRSSEAEWDAFFRLALLYYEEDRAKYHQAYEAILKAERFAVLGIHHERVAKPEPEVGFVIGEVMPVEFPVRLLPLWRLSLILHLMSGDLSYPEIRAGFTLPADQWNPRAIAAQLAKAARQAHRDLSGLPPENRPSRYDELPRMAEHYERIAAGDRQRTPSP